MSTTSASSPLSLPDSLCPTCAKRGWTSTCRPTFVRVDSLKAGLERLVAGAMKERPDVDLYMRFEDTYAGYEISSERLFVGTLKDVFVARSMEWQPQQFRSHSDANVLWAAGIDPVILGPGRLELAHSEDESVPFEEVVAASRLYLDLALSVR